MLILFLVLIILASVVLSLFILVQNPKGGGLAGNIAGFNSQFMGVKQTTDVLEKGTWVMAILIGLLSLFSGAFFQSSTGGQVVPGPGTPPAGTNVNPGLAPEQSQDLPLVPGNNLQPDSSGQ